ncbi:NIPSNAP family protein [Dehalococcoidia bacterium]|nr:NIPSNAP family protein [Dehalococcoidia bacterium]
MIYDMRIYDLKPGSVNEYMAAVKEVALQIRGDYGVKLAGWYYTDIGPLNRIVHIWAYKDYHHFAEAREQVRSDPRWSGEYMPRVRGLAVKQQDMIMNGADFFPGPV